MLMAHFKNPAESGVLALGVAAGSSMSCFVCLLLLLASAVVHVEQAAALSPDGQALLRFKDNIVDPKGTLSTWNASHDTPCAWRGVTCSQGNSSVSRLDLPAGDLEGTLSSSLGLLANLTALDLDYNHLSGPIPPEIVQAKLLSSLVLSRNRLNGSIPANISQLRGLEELSLFDNSLSGSIPGLDGLASLTSLRVEENQLTGDLPSSLAALTKLSILHVGINKFTGIKTPDFTDLQDLESLHMSDSQLEGPLPTGIATMLKLRELNLSSNLLTGHISDDHWYDKNSLSFVDLSRNQLNGSIPRLLLQMLQWDPSHQSGSLNLSNNRLTGAIPDTLNIKYNGGLLTVDISNNHLEGPIPTTFGEAPVRTLRLQNNQLSGDMTSVWSNLATNLTDLQLQGNSVTGRIGAATCKTWKDMEFLDLSTNYVDLVEDSLSIMLNTFPDLKELRLSSISSSGRLPSRSMITNSSLKLEVLDLSHSHLEGDLFQSFLVDAELLLPKLRFLDLSGNLLSGRVPPSLTRIVNLSSINLSDNNLSGLLPSFPPRLRNATSFDGNPGLCGIPLTPCIRKPNTLVLKLVIALVACAFAFSATTCLFLAWRVRLYSKRHEQDADLIAALRGENGAHLMPLADLRKATSNFAHEIGVGGFGCVYKGELKDGTLVAVKKSKGQGCARDKDQFLNEVKILSQVHHCSLVRLLGCCLANKIALLVLEFVPNGTLQQHLRGKNGSNIRLTWWQRLRIALQTADALSYLHESAVPPIIHRDVKSANILLDQNLNAKVADFGLSKLASLEDSHISTQAQGTFGYIDPEYYTRSKLTTKSDVYSFGVVLLEIISAQRPVDLRRGDDASLVSFAVALIRSGDLQEILDPAISETFNSATGKQSIEGVGKLAVKCLEDKSGDRPTMREAWKELHALGRLFSDATSGSWNPVTLGGVNVDEDSADESDVAFPQNAWTSPQIGGKSATAPSFHIERDIGRHSV